jgi:AcrR family transcriptional regulator
MLRCSELPAAAFADKIAVMTEVTTGAARERAIDAAEALLTESGASSVSLGAVAHRLGVPLALVTQHFAHPDDLYAAMAERWFRPMVAIMEEVVASDLPPRRKMFEFYARRFVLIRRMYDVDPVQLRHYVEIGNEHFEAVRSYVDLGDHYLCEIIAEAMAEGHFAGFAIDDALSLINQMVASYVNIALMTLIMPKLSEEKLGRIVDTIFDGLSGDERGARGITGMRAA